VTDFDVRISKFAPKIRMRDRGEGFRASPQTLPEQVDRTIFGDNPMNMAACGYHASAGFERGDYARNGSVACSRRQRNDRYASG
jgi:hypothetical protein